MGIILDLTCDCGMKDELIKPYGNGLPCGRIVEVMKN